jgi:hypothetical protein
MNRKRNFPRRIAQESEEYTGKDNVEILFCVERGSTDGSQKDKVHKA